MRYPVLAFHRAMLHRARFCYNKSSVRPSVRPSVGPTVRLWRWGIVVT